MTPPEELTSFIGATFRSVWALELLLLLKREGRACTPEELVSLLRASRSVVENALNSLIAAGLVGEDGECFSYMPASAQLAVLVDDTEAFYRARPNRVRRLIVAKSHQGLAAFSDAFRLKD